MKIAFSILIFIHGLIHLLGFAKGFGLREVKELTIPISKTMGLFWLIAALFFLIFCVFYLMNHQYSWLVGIAAVISSQILIILFWHDAKFATLPNIAVLLVSLMAFGNYNFQKLVQLETSDILSQNIISSERIVSEDDTKDLPKPVQNWLKQSGIIGKPFINVGQVMQEAQIKLKLEQEDWLNATAVQYTTIHKPAFIWTVDVKMNSLMSFHGRDKFEDGAGEMLIKLNALFSLVNEKGPKLDEGSIQRYLGEMVWFPTLAMSQYITWQEINGTTAIATMDYKGTKGSGTFYFDSVGNFIKFSALRFQGNDPEAKRNEWVLLVEEYNTFEGITIPSKMTATWKLENEDWTWLKLEIKDIKYNENIRH